MPESNYEPEVDDYVIWERESWVGITTDQGWVYFKGDTTDNDKRVKLKTLKKNVV